jgi:hypothetical protein
LIGLIAAARSPGRVFELIDLQPTGNRLHVLAYERCDGHVQSLSLIGSVTTWRDLDGNEIRDRKLIEWLYAQWLAHKPVASPSRR